jgi:hypothetical protein
MLNHAPPDRDRDRIVEQKYRRPFILVTSLFFALAFAASLNDVLIRQFQKALLPHSPCTWHPTSRRSSPVSAT